MVPHVSVVADAKTALGQLLPLVEPKREHEWLTQIDQWREEHPVHYVKREGFLQPQEVLEEMYARCHDEAIVIADVGNNQIWSALWFNYAKPGRFLNSGGMGTMGYAFPASMGVKLSNPDRTVFCVTGDGGFLMNMQEMATMVENQIDVKVDHPQQQLAGHGPPVPGRLLRRRAERGPAQLHPRLREARRGLRDEGAPHRPRARMWGAMLDEALAHRGPVLLAFDIDPRANVYPIVPLGKGMLDFVEAS